MPGNSTLLTSIRSRRCRYFLCAVDGCKIDLNAHSFRFDDYETSRAQLSAEIASTFEQKAIFTARKPRLGQLGLISAKISDQKPHQLFSI